jgi:hypothetical protein
MKIIARRFAAVFLLMALSACTLEMPSPIGATAEQYTSGAPIKTWALTEKQENALTDWFKQHPTDWSPSYASYVPRLLVRLKHADGKMSSVNVLSPGLVVVASPDGQFTQSFEAKVVEQLIASIGAAGG